MYSSVLLEVKDGIATLSFNRPRVLNALDAEMLILFWEAAERVVVNSLLPRTTIATAAAYCILIRDSRATTGNFFIDEDVLRAQGILDFSGYAVTPGAKLFPDLFLN